MKKNQKQNSSDDELRFENEFRKLKISLETGARFYSDDDAENEIPPEIETKFLDNIEAFDKALQSAEEILLYDFLGKPNFKKESELTDEELPDALDNLQELMCEKGIMCIAIYDVEDRVIYKFITEELFLKSTTNISLPGFMHNFIYEEFYPNHREDVKSLCKDLLIDFFNNRLQIDFWRVEESNRVCYQELLIFRNTLSKIRDASFDELSLEMSGHMATVLCNVEYDGIVSEGMAPIHYKGEGEFKLEYHNEYDFWHFTHIKIPGMRNKV